MHIELRSSSVIAGALVTGIALAGCGGSNGNPAHSSSASTVQSASTTHTDPQSAPTVAQSIPTAPAHTSQAKTATTSTTAAEKVPSISIPIKSSVALKPIPSRYTCDGANVSLPLSWSSVPANTVEMDLFIFQTKMPHEKLAAAWAVAGLRPGLHKLSAGQLPLGAVVGLNSFGKTRYSVCPSKGQHEEYVVQLDPLPRRIHVRPGFDPEALVNRAVKLAEFEGQTYISYTRR